MLMVKNAAISGNVMLQNCRQGLAPSMDASEASPGIVCRPAMYRIVAKATACHTCTTTTPHQARSGSARIFVATGRRPPGWTAGPGWSWRKDS
jgi:hypothetical protein